MKSSAKIVCIYILWIILSCNFIQQSFAETLELNDNTAELDNTVVFELMVNNAPNIVGSFGFEIEYDPEILSFQGFEEGSLIKDRYNIFDVTTPSHGIIRIGGLTSNSKQKIQQNESGVLVLMRFTVLKNSNDVLKLQKLIDHIKDWSVKNGHLSVSQSSYEDINKDGKAGLAEVIHLLQLMSGF
ncbi:secreted protein containing Cellulosome anchoring protein, cohesin region domain protein [Candidatus Magnetomorum sp. HK-1]|nr:secreted protein containing Cellulosome anchoring protein, cohesin region domain protein [Candidatus Magnetomorum sp. HK-1]